MAEIAAQALGDLQMMAGSAEEAASISKTRVAARVFVLLLQPKLLDCILKVGLQDPVCQAPAAEILRQCAAALHALSSAGLSGIFGDHSTPHMRCQQLPEHGSDDDADGLTGAAGQWPGSRGGMVDRSDPNEVGSHEEPSLTVHGWQTGNAMLMECGTRLVECVPWLTCCLHLGSNISDALALITAWQQQQQQQLNASRDNIDDIRELLRHLDMLLCVQQLFHKMPSVRAAAATRILVVLGGSMPADPVLDWNQSFEDLTAALAMSAPQTHAPAPTATSCIR